MNQSQKSVAITLGGLALAGALVGYAYFGVKTADEKESVRKEVTERIFSAAAEAKPKDGGTIELTFTALEVSAKGETTRLTKENSQWTIVSPLEASADKFAVEGLTSQLQTAKFKELLEEHPSDADLEKYGLRSPKFTVVGVAKLPDGREKTLKVYGGIENTFDGSVYMRREGDPAIYTAEGGLRWALEKNTFELRSKEVVALDEAKISRIEVRSGKKELSFEKDAAKKWSLKKPAAFQADADEVGALISALKNERAQAFPTDSAKALGLETPAAETSLILDDGKVVRVRLSAATSGQDAGGGKNYAWAEQDGKSVISEVGPSPLAALQKPPDDFKDKTALTFEKERVAKIRIRATGEQPVVLERGPAADGGTSDTWRVTAPAPGKAKTFKVSSLLWALSSLRATTLGDENPKDWRKLGIDDKAPAVTLEDAEGKTLGVLQRGKDVPQKAGQIYARGTRNLALEIESSRLADLMPKLADLLDAPSAAPGNAGAPTGPGVSEIQPASLGNARP